MSCEEAIELMDRQFVEGLPEELARALRAHLEGCAPCRDRHDRLSAVERHLELGFSPERTAQLQSELFARLEPAPSAPRRWPRVAAGAVAALASLAAVLVWWPGPQEFQGRGGHADGYTLRALCVRQGKVVSATRERAPVRCRRGDLLQLSYSAPAAAVLGVRSADAALVLVDASGTAPVVAGTEVTLPFSTPVGDWLTAPVRFEATFRDPVTGAERARREFTVELEPDAPGP